VIHESEQAAVAPHRTNIDKFKRDVTHRWMRRRCSMGFLEQGASSPCLMTTNTATQWQGNTTPFNCPPADAPALYLAGSTPLRTAYRHCQFAVIFRKYYPVHEKKIIAVSFHYI
jgi:hypothetical protein